MKNQVIKVALYARVSTRDKDQNPETQLFALRSYCKGFNYEIVAEYVDQASAKDYIKRKQWQELQKDIRQRKFSIVLCYKLDRCFRNVRDCLNALEEWYERGVKFKCITQDSIDTTTSGGKFVLQILAAAAELESSLISDRVTAGMARAKAEGKHLGRQLLNISVTDISDTLKKTKAIQKTADVLKCSRAYIYQELAKEGTNPKEVIDSVRKGSQKITRKKLVKTPC